MISAMGNAMREMGDSAIYNPYATCMSEISHISYKVKTRAYFALQSGFKSASAAFCF